MLYRSMNLAFKKINSSRDYMPRAIKFSVFDSSFVFVNHIEPRCAGDEPSI